MLEKYVENCRTNNTGIWNGLIIIREAVIKQFQETKRIKAAIPDSAKNSKNAKETLSTIEKRLNEAHLKLLEAQNQIDFAKSDLEKFTKSAYYKKSAME